MHVLSMLVLIRLEVCASTLLFREIGETERRCHANPAAHIMTPKAPGPTGEVRIRMNL